jgi:hypothetical protein
MPWQLVSPADMTHHPFCQFCGQAWLKTFQIGLKSILCDYCSDSSVDLRGQWQRDRGEGGAAAQVRRYSRAKEVAEAKFTYLLVYAELLAYKASSFMKYMIPHFTVS